MSMRKSLVWNYGAHFLVFAVTLGSTIVVSRLLTPHELGIFSVGIAISGLLGTLSYFGVANYLIRDQALSEQTLATGFTVNAIMCLVVGAILWQLGTIGQPLFSDPAIPRVLLWLALVPVIGIFEFLPATLLTREMQFGRTPLLQLGKATFNAVGVVGFAHQGWSYLSPAFGAVIGAAFGALGYSIVGRRHVRLRLSLQGARVLAVFSAQMISAGGIPLVAARIAELIIAQFLGLSALGLYTRASGLAAMVWDGAYGLSTRIIYVQMAAELRDTGSLRETFLRATKLLTAVMWPVMAGIAVLSAPIIQLLYGAGWEGAALPLSILMAGQFVMIGFAMNWELCVLTNRTAWQARTEVTRAVIGLAAFAAGALLSLPAAALGRVVDAVFGYLIYRPRMADMAGATSAEIGDANNGSLVLTPLAIGPAIGLMVVSRWSPAVPMGQIAIAVVAGGALWMFALYATRHPLFKELVSLARPWK